MPNSPDIRHASPEVACEKLDLHSQSNGKLQTGAIVEVDTPSKVDKRASQDFKMRIVTKQRIPSGVPKTTAGNANRLKTNSDKESGGRGLSDFE